MVSPFYVVIISTRMMSPFFNGVHHSKNNVNTHDVSLFMLITIKKTNFNPHGVSYFLVVVTIKKEFSTRMMSPFFIVIISTRMMSPLFQWCSPFKKECQHA